MVNNGHSGAKIQVGFRLPSHVFFASYAPRAVSVSTEGYGPSLVNYLVFRTAEIAAARTFAAFDAA